MFCYRLGGAGGYRIKPVFSFDSLNVFFSDLVTGGFRVCKFSMITYTSQCFVQNTIFNKLRSLTVDKQQNYYLTAESNDNYPHYLKVDTNYNNIWNKKLTAISGILAIISSGSLYTLSEISSDQTKLYQLMQISYSSSPSKNSLFLTTLNTSDGTVHGKQYIISKYAYPLLNLVLKEPLLYSLFVSYYSPDVVYVFGYNIATDTFMQVLTAPKSRPGSIINFGADITNQR